MTKLPFKNTEVAFHSTVNSNGNTMQFRPKCLGYHIMFSVVSDIYIVGYSKVIQRTTVYVQKTW